MLYSNMTCDAEQLSQGMDISILKISVIELQKRRRYIEDNSKIIFLTS